jgi:hypothetical protein
MLIFLGFGTSSRTWELDKEGHITQLVCKYNYFAPFFFFPVSWGETWYLLGDKRSEDKEIPYSEVKALVPHGTPKLDIWTKWGLFLALGFFVLLITALVMMVGKK